MPAHLSAAGAADNSRCASSTGNAGIRTPLPPCCLIRRSTSTDSPTLYFSSSASRWDAVSCPRWDACAANGGRRILELAKQGLRQSSQRLHGPKRGRRAAAAAQNRADPGPGPPPGRVQATAHARAQVVGVNVVAVRACWLRWAPSECGLRRPIARVTYALLDGPWHAGGRSSRPTGESRWPRNAPGGASRGCYMRVAYNAAAWPRQAGHSGGCDEAAPASHARAGCIGSSSNAALAHTSSVMSATDAMPDSGRQVIHQHWPLPATA